MAFFSRFFSKKSSSLRSTTVASGRASSSSSSEDEGPISAPAMTGVLSAPADFSSLVSGRRLGTSDRSAVPSVGRRVGGEMRRSQTYTSGATPSYASIHASTRPSMSSCDGTSMDDRLRQQYAKLRQTHVGRMAVILEGVDRRTKQPVIIKAYAKASMTASMQEQVEREQAILRTAASCPGVVRLLDTLDDATNHYVVLENVPGYTLIELMAQHGGRIHEARCVQEVVTPLLRALAALHALGLVHRDVKPEHIICAHGGVKLVDFALAAQQRHQCLNSRLGQLEYMAPEVLSKPTAADIFHTVLSQGMSEGELPQYDEKVDVWSMGCVAYEALTGQQPFMAESPAELAALHDSLLSSSGPNSAPLLLQHPCISKLACDFLATVLQVDPAQRPSALDLLQHPWITQHAPRRSSSQSQWIAPMPTGGASLGSARVVMESSSASGVSSAQPRQHHHLVGHMAAGLEGVPHYRTSTSASALPDHHTTPSGSSSSSNDSTHSSLSADMLAVATAAAAAAPRVPRSPLQACCMSTSPRASLGELKAQHLQPQQHQQQQHRVVSRQAQQAASAAHHLVPSPAVAYDVLVPGGAPGAHVHVR